MKKALAVAVLTCTFAAFAVPSHAHRYDRAADNPARIIGYLVHPVGLALEYAVMRPIHWFASQPNLDIIHGHQPSVREDGTYFEWVHGDYTPSIAKERETARNNNNQQAARAAN